MPMPSISYNEQRLETARNGINRLRTHINSVRAGFNPVDVGHPHGFPLNSLTVAAGGDAFPSGVNFKAKLRDVGGAVDTAFTGHEASLGKLSRALTVNLRLGQDAEYKNVNTANTVGLPNTTTHTTTPTTNTSTNTTSTSTNTTKPN
ncbi:hypothetical protein EV382_2653 [Micromonospora violae]|uniref:Excreted virulence factor EspC (Type VII ESX diderm) n=1 Tax=Micromonospora violae TaxID=1278207 RepID=A0A4Q7UF75_9ACTN|nr:hypothetical protein [Micromonospora violae]RZT79454.1 hypothetical protein EV382_2653 [Micromonospora violae]